MHSIEDLKTKYGIPYTLHIVGIIDEELEAYSKNCGYTVWTETDLGKYTEEIDIVCAPILSFHNDFDENVNNFVEAHREKWEKETDRRVMKAMYEMVADIVIDNEELTYIDLSFTSIFSSGAHLIYVLNETEVISTDDYDDIVFHLEKLSKKDISEYYRE